MKWGMAIRPKLTASLLLASVLVLLAWNNISEKSRLQRLEKSFASIYEDRLMAETYLFRISGLLNERRAARFEYKNEGQKSTLQSDSMARLLTLYETTLFTPEESLHFQRLKLCLAELKQMPHSDSEYALSPGSNPAVYSAEQTVFDSALLCLNELSGIQVSEGRHMQQESRSILSSYAVLTQFETILLIIVALIIQVLIFSYRVSAGRILQKPGLN